MANRDNLRVRGQWREPAVKSKTCLWPGWQITSLQIGQWVSSSFSLQKVLRITLESIEVLMLQCLGPVPVRVGLTSRSLPSEVISRLETKQDLLASLALPSSPTEKAPLVTDEEAAPSTEEIPPVTEETSPSIQETIPVTEESSSSTEETPLVTEDGSTYSDDRLDQ